MATRILLRSRADGCFVAGILTWCPSADGAHEFPKAQFADDFARERALKKIEIIVIRDKGPPLHILLDRGS